MLLNHLPTRLFPPAGGPSPPRPTSCRGSCRNRHWRSGTDAPLFLKLFDQSSNLQHRQVAELLHQFVCLCHFSLFLQLPSPKAFEELKPIAIGSDNVRFVAVAAALWAARVAQRRGYKIFYAAAAPSFSAFAFNNRAKHSAGSFQRTTRRGARGTSSPSKCASKISRG